ncbi:MULTISPECIES: DUF885 domain-containing protein [unclassified Wenzhouxiangella]|uniref:DUF885 domain-containing protein n=1 Tax=unclassified Wenzhouxiangella TaxID=2613841 RepID=UPI000E32CAD1|nr:MULTISPECIES: DUF885 domain-containing protein [unclassified Wenzhouxiangella]RFF26445.1 DUF885 domain-containing protein [Wenzhouxiangella sp. 15181]RFP67282.1 DUF885 domain-containing protein [Wenzhouxiangella sp. 15190]
MTVINRFFALSLLLVLCACADQSEPDRAGAGDESAQATAGQGTSDSSEPAAAETDVAAFDAFADQLIDEMLQRSPEWAIYQGRYENAGEVSIPDAAHRRDELAFVADALERLGEFDREALPVDQRTDYDLLENRLESARFYTRTLRSWEWQPSNYNVAGPLNILLNTEFAPLPERLALIRDRLEHVPAYYEAARESLGTPTLEHTELAISQNRGSLSVLDDIREKADEAQLDADLSDSLSDALAGAEAAIEDWVGWLEQRLAKLEESGNARPFRLGEALYEEKFAYDIQADFTAAELYRRAQAEKERLLDEMDGYTKELWPKYFTGEPMPEDRLARIGQMIDRLSQEHVAVEDFVDEIRQQIPELAEFVRENDLLDQDPDKPLIVRETPEYMRGSGAIASVSAPGPFNPDADTYYNVTPLETFGEEQAASYLREYNDWMLQILNIHEGIPGHYTQLLHANKSPSLVKSLFGNGAMVEGWAVYAERMMLEQGWGDQAPELWLMHGKWLLRVTHNAILDYAVHVRGMERDEAVRMMREEAFQEKSEATQKWRRLTLTQVQLTSYYAGYSAIYDLRERLKAEQGEDFDLKAFHNEFLSYGSAPVNTIAELMSESE